MTTILCSFEIPTAYSGQYENIPLLNLFEVTFCLLAVITVVLYTTRLFSSRISQVNLRIISCRLRCRLLHFIWNSIPAGYSFHNCPISCHPRYESKGWDRSLTIRANSLLPSRDAEALKMESFCSQLNLPPVDGSCCLVPTYALCSNICSILESYNVALMSSLSVLRSRVVPLCRDI